MPSSRAEIEKILQNAKSAFENAKNGLEILNGNNYDQYPFGFHSVAVFGRSVTFILQNLRSKVNNFDLWYGPYVEEMNKDPLMARFKDIRNSIEKEGVDDVVSTTYVKRLDQSILVRMPAPPGCIGYFFGDRYGRSGFNIKLPDGTADIIYFDPGKFSLTSVSTMKKAPTKHLGADVSNQTLHGLCKLYLNYLEAMLENALLEFLSKNEY